MKPNTNANKDAVARLVKHLGPICAGAIKEGISEEMISMMKEVNIVLWPYPWGGTVDAWAFDTEYKTTITFKKLVNKYLKDCEHQGGDASDQDYKKRSMEAMALDCEKAAKRIRAMIKRHKL